MRKLLTSLLVLLCTTSIAQRNRIDDEHENFFRIGAKGGVNVNKISGQSYKQGFRYNFQAGAFLQFNFSRRFGIQPEVNFVQTSSEFSNDANDIYDDVFRDGSQKTSKLNYLEIPVLLNINVGATKRIKIQLGPQYGNLLKQTIDSLKSGGDIYHKAEWSVLGGIWFQLPFVNLGARYKLGLTNLNGIDDRQQWKSQAIQVFVGFTL
jgi:hypothetical protein